MQKFNRYLFPIFAHPCLSRKQFHRVSMSVATAGILCTSTGLANAVIAEPAVSPADRTGTGLTAAASAPGASLPDGTYLYGQSPKPDQVGKGYFVFEVNQRRVIGALYMPRSSFDCASGSFSGNQLALTVVNSYDRTTNPFDIALEGSSNVASSAASGNSIGLQGFHRISNISQNDRRILHTCKTDLKK